MKPQAEAVLNWGNRSTMCYANADFYGYPQAVNRLAVEGDDLLAADDETGRGELVHERCDQKHEAEPLHANQ